MSTPLNSTSGTGTGSSFWKVLAIIVVGLIALAILWPLIRGLFWLGVVALAVYGGYMLFRSKPNNGVSRY